MRSGRKWPALVLVLLHSFVAHGSQSGASPIARERLPGIWEAVVPEEGRVFLVEVTDTKTTAVTGLLGSEDQVYQIRFAITDTDVTRGRVTWTGSATGETARYRVRIEGPGTEDGGYGRIKARWILQDPAGRKVPEWRPLLIGRKESYLGRLSRAANLLRDQTKD
jgi:hypothetical protein